LESRPEPFIVDYSGTGARATTNTAAAASTNSAAAALTHTTTANPVALVSLHPHLLPHTTGLHLLFSQAIISSTQESASRYCTLAPPQYTHVDCEIPSRLVVLSHNILVFVFFCYATKSIHLQRNDLFLLPMENDPFFK